MKPRRVFAQFLQKPQHRVTCAEIPTDLACEILEKELEIEKAVTVKLINDLIALYTKAVEHYETQENPKYLDFQERMHKMLLKPEIFSVLQQCNEKSPSESKILEKKHETPKEQPTDLSSSLDKRKEQAEESRKNFSLQLNSALTVSKTMNSLSTLLSEHVTSTESASNSAKSELKAQEQSLEQKLLARRTSQKSKIFADSQHSRTVSNIICDISDMDDDIASSTKSSLCPNEENSKEIFERFEKKLEEIMEKSHEERASKIFEIKFKYESQINELSEGGEIMQMVVDQLKKNMEKEMDEISEYYDSKRKTEIKRIKEELYN